VSRILDRLMERELRGVDVDEIDRFVVHSQVLARKRILRDVFTEFHQTFDRLDRMYLTGVGARIELGAGVSPIRASYPDVLATDIVPAEGLDRVLNAQAMDLPDGSVRALFGQNCFHHFPDPRLFLDEALRVLSVGGGVVLLEPYYGPVASFLFKRIFASEGFDKSCPTWSVSQSGPMNGANQALSYLVFNRDRSLFEKEYPSFRIVHHGLCGNYLRYLLSGGLNFKSLCPDGAADFLKVVERLVSPLNRWIALHHVIVLRKEL